MKSIKNIEQLHTEQQRLKHRQKELEKTIRLNYRGVVNDFRPSGFIKKGLLSVVERIVKKCFR